jgi:hypothetical protein
MNTEQHRNEIAEINKHVKMLNITGGIAVGFISLAGFLLATDALDSNAVPDNRASEQVIAMEEVDQISDEQQEAVAVSINQPIPDAKENNSSQRNIQPEKSAAPSKVSSFEEELQSFEASCNAGSISFHWVTLGSTKYAFEIEKTYDQVNFEVFSRAPQPEKKDGKNIYNVEEAINTGDEAFYRLRKVLGKNKFEYSEIVKVRCTEKEAYPTSVDVFPNGSGSFRIMINTAKAGPYKVTLTDVNEAELATEEFQAQQGSNEFVLSSSSITHGNYTLRVSNENMVKEKRVVLK